MHRKPLFPTTRELPYSPLRQTRDAILNLIYPQECLVCGAPVARHQDRGVCNRCWKRTLELRLLPPWCPSCGMPFAQASRSEGSRSVQSSAQESAHLCGKCILDMPPYSGARSFGYYTSDLKQLIQAFKFKGRQDLADLLSPLLATTCLESWPDEELDLLVPVPLHPKRKRERGFNQAALLGSMVARFLGVQYCERALTRVRATLPQVGLSDPERLRNVRNAFRCIRPGVVLGKRLLLLDDVMTTGATVTSATRALIAGGALRVAVVTIARAVPGMG